MENEKTEFKQAKDQKMTLIGITLETSKDNLHVDRIRFVTEQGDITYRPSITKEEFRDIFELINPIFGKVHPEKAGCIAKYYIRLLKKNEVGTLNLIDKYRQGVKNGCEFDKSIRLREGHPIFDTAFKKQFEEELKHGHGGS